MSLSAFAIAVLLLLLTPGPTNTLLAVSGASRGLKASLPLIAAELAGYLTTILPLVFLAAPLLSDQPLVALGVKLASSAWVLLLAVRLWTRPPAICATGGINGACVYCTTVLNPKGLIIGLALIPSASLSSFEALSTPLAYLAVFALLVMIVATGWLSVGAAVLRGVATARPRLIGRVAASFLVLFAVSLAGRAVGLI
ncbi:LysE family translocator [Rhizobium sp. G187]|uniref:LysE family translocator n=1 Tax=Rhizobium sp. G187 TaxID=3451352 RepID=UPI003EE44AAF